MSADILLSKDRDQSAVELVDVYSNDRSAIEAWLQSKPTASPNSIRAYRQAVEHLWKWCAKRCGVAAADMLIKLRTTEAQGYFSDMVRQPERPSDKLLSAKTVKHRITILASMYAYWLRARDGGRAIVEFNPFDGMAAQVETAGPGNTGAVRSLSREEQAAVEAAIERLPQDSESRQRHYRRARLIWMLASRLALRRAEISDLRCNDIRLASSGRHWRLEIHGKGRKHNQAPDVIIVPDVVIEEISAYRKAFGLHPSLLPSDSSFLIRHVSERSRAQKLSDAHVGRIMKEIFSLAAQYAERDLRAPQMAPRLREASIHWGRHTWFMNALDEHDLRLVSRAGRHRDIRTTMKSYVGTSEEDLAKVMSSGKALGG